MANGQRSAAGRNEEDYSAFMPIAEEVEAAEEIDLVALLYRLLENARYIAAAALAGAVLVGIWAILFTTPQYTATSKLYVMDSSEAAINLSDFQIGTYLTADYAEVFKNWHVHEMVIRELDLPYSYDQLTRKLRVTNPTNTRVLYLSFTSPDPQEAKIVADTYAKKAQEFIGSMMDTKIPNLFEEALLPVVPSSRSKLSYVVVGFLAGFVIACAWFVIRFIVDDRILSGEDIEKCPGMQVLGIMPVINSKSSSSRKAYRKG